MLSGKTKYCIQCLVAMASAPAHRPVTASALAERLRVSISHTEALVSALRSAGFIRSARGPGGGYYLDCDPDKLSVWAVVHALDPKFRDPSVPAVKGSPIADLEAAILDTFIEFLSSHTIGEYACDSSWTEEAHTHTGSRFRLQPMPQRLRPVAPNSVFQLSTFRQLSAA